jgi:DNA (cytosine-5)-methyltransferase 1
LDLFSGIGGITKALEGYVEPIAYCESDRYCQSVLLSRMGTHDLPTAPIWDNVRTLQPSDLPFLPDIIYGGFPCQDISVAGRGAGLDGERSGLFFEIVRLCGEIQPRFVFLENVAEIINNGGVRVIEELTALRYDCKWLTISASFVGAHHERKRWFLVGHTNSFNAARSCKTDRQNLHLEIRTTEKNITEWSGRFDELVSRNVAQRANSYSDALRVLDGIPFRVDRLRGLGNAVVPQQAREAFERLMGLK